jgi:hypothetical protein
MPFLLALVLGPAVHGAELDDYYVLYPAIPGAVPLPGLPPLAPQPANYPPEVRVTGGGTDPLPLNGRFPVDRMMAMIGAGNNAASPLLGAFAGPRNGPCGTDWKLFTSPATPEAPIRFVRRTIGFSTVVTRYFSPTPPSSTGGCTVGLDISPAQARWTFDDRFTMLAPKRRKASDGSEYDASALVQLRNGVPWMTYHFGYRLGLVASEANWQASSLAQAPALSDWPDFPDPRDNFELAKLPSPFIEGEVIEYVNYQVSPNSAAGHYFYAATTAEQRLLDAATDWSRTGLTFKSGGFVSVCRFYSAGSGNQSGTHFYSTDDCECAQLRGVSFLQYEGEVFRASRPIPPRVAGASATCPAGSLPLYRFYNNAPGRGFASNHRYLVGRGDATLLGSSLTGAGWSNEGLVMCVPDAP